MQSGNGAETKFAWRLQVAVIVSRERKGAPVAHTERVSLRGRRRACKVPSIHANGTVRPAGLSSELATQELPLLKGREHLLVVLLPHECHPVRQSVPLPRLAEMRDPEPVVRVSARATLPPAPSASNGMP